MKTRFLPVLLLVALPFVPFNFPGHTAPPATTVAAPGEIYFGSEKSSVFHVATCAALDKVKDDNIVKYNSRAEAIKAGKRPCAKCKP